jgi:hypothetical protein
MLRGPGSVPPRPGRIGCGGLPCPDVCVLAAAAVTRPAAAVLRTVRREGAMVLSFLWRWRDDRGAAAMGSSHESVLIAPPTCVDLVGRYRPTSRTSFRAVANGAASRRERTGCTRRGCNTLLPITLLRKAVDQLSRSAHARGRGDHVGSPYQEFTFPDTTAKYLKIKVLPNYGGSPMGSTFLKQIRLIGRPAT